MKSLLLTMCLTAALVLGLYVSLLSSSELHTQIASKGMGNDTESGNLKRLISPPSRVGAGAAHCPVLSLDPYYSEWCAANETEVDARVISAQGPEFPLDATTTARFLVLLGAAGLLIAALVVRFRIREASLTLAVRRQGASDERLRIARILHDSLLQNVYGLHLKVEAAISRLPKAEPARKVLEDAQEAAEQAVDECIDQIRKLRLELVDGGDIIDALKAAAKQSHSDNCRVTIRGELPPLDCHVKAEIFAIIREAMNNALRHAHASVIDVLFRQTPAGLEATVTDNGVGMSNSGKSHSPQGHFGLTGMRERTMAIHGELLIESVLGSGTRVILLLNESMFRRWQRIFRGDSHFSRAELAMHRDRKPMHRFWNPQRTIFRRPTAASEP